jgi:hypothetical protein
MLKIIFCNGFLPEDRGVVRMVDRWLSTSVFYGLTRGQKPSLNPLVSSAVLCEQANGSGE